MHLRQRMEAGEKLSKFVNLSLELLLTTFQRQHAGGIRFRVILADKVVVNAARTRRSGAITLKDMKDVNVNVTVIHI